MRDNDIKCAQEGAVTRKYDAACEKGGDNFKKSDFNQLYYGLQYLSNITCSTTHSNHQESGIDVEDSRIENFASKARRLKTTFTQIDTVATGVSAIAAHLDLLERAAEKIQDEIDDSPLKKMMGFFKTQTATDIHIPSCFSSDQLFLKKL